MYLIRLQISSRDRRRRSRSGSRSKKSSRRKDSKRDRSRSKDKKSRSDDKEKSQEKVIEIPENSPPKEVEDITPAENNGMEVEPEVKEEMPIET